jgi:TraX protein
MRYKTFNTSLSLEQTWAEVAKILTVSFRLPFIEPRVQNVLKLAALTLMLADHVHLVFFDRSLVWLYWLTRLVFPMFMLLAAHNLERYHARPGKYILQLLCFGLLAQPFYFVSFGHNQLNVMFTIAAGVALYAVLKWSKTRVHWALRLVGLMGLILVPFPIDGGWYGVMSIPMFAALMRRGAWWDWLLAVFVLVSIVAGATPWFVPLSVLVIWVLAARVPSGTTTPKPSHWAKLASYGFYPAHLAVIAFVLKVF